MPRTTVLVVEDQWNLRKLSVLALQTSGYKVIEAENGAQAIEKLSKSKVELILTDWSMPVMNGQQMLEEIQQTQQTADVPVVVLSRHRPPRASDVDLQSLGVHSWLQKPCRISTLRNTVSSILDMKCQPAFS